MAGDRLVRPGELEAEVLDHPSFDKSDARQCG